MSAAPWERVIVLVIWWRQPRLNTSNRSSVAALFRPRYKSVGRHIMVPACLTMGSLFCTLDPLHVPMRLLMWCYPLWLPPINTSAENQDRRYVYIHILQQNIPNSKRKLIFAELILYLINFKCFSKTNWWTRVTTRDSETAWLNENMNNKNECKAHLFELIVLSVHDSIGAVQLASFIL